MRRISIMIFLVSLFILSNRPALGQDSLFTSSTVRLKYMTPDDLFDCLSAERVQGAGYQCLIMDRTLSLRINPSNNQIFLSGAPVIVSEGRRMIDALDIPPRQIETSVVMGLNIREGKKELP